MGPPSGRLVIGIKRERAAPHASRDRPYGFWLPHAFGAVPPKMLPWQHPNP